MKANINTRTYFIGALILNIGICLMSMESVFARDVRINNPKVGGYALDICREWAANCGKPAADAYCQSKGYRGAVDFSVQNDSPTTRVINDGQVCDQPFCDRITSVVCKADDVFRNPTVGGYALDICREWAANCGKPAADAYCQSKGYRGAVDFSVQNDSPTTRVINDGQVCDQPFCDRITSVTCR